jgi:uncharacterized protein YbjT (DUF2867 family)
MAILLTGGTGTLGRHVLPLLRDRGHDLRILTRGPQRSEHGAEHVTGDLRAGTGIEPAVDGIETIVHLAGGPKGDDEATRNLVRAAARAGVQHIVHISVIGADRVPLGYFRAKLGAEKAVAESGIPFSTLRAAQFHDLVLTVVRRMASLPVVPVPDGLRFQPVDAREVAARLAELSLGAPAGAVADLAGPAVHGVRDLVTGYLHARGKRRPMVPVRIPGNVGRAYRAGDNLNLTTATHGERAWQEFLIERLSARKDTPSPSSMSRLHGERLSTGRHPVPPPAVDVEVEPER